MKTIKAFIEIGNDKSYSVYPDLEDNTLNYGIFGEGNTVEEAIADFKSAYIGMKKLHEEKGERFVEAEFKYVYDVASFLRYYNAYLSLAGISKLTGINQNMLSQYITGRRNPSDKTVEKIKCGIHSFGNELSQLRFS